MPMFLSEDFRPIEKFFTSATAGVERQTSVGGHSIGRGSFLVYIRDQASLQYKSDIVKGSSIGSSLFPASSLSRLG